VAIASIFGPLQATPCRRTRRPAGVQTADVERP
jgi:hypothetical protein